MVSASATGIASSESIKAYVDDSKGVRFNGQDSSGAASNQDNVVFLGVDSDTLSIDPDAGPGLAALSVRLQDDDTMAGATATGIASSESIKAYVDNTKMAISGESSGLVTIDNPTNLRFDQTQFELFPNVATGFVEVALTSGGSSAKKVEFSSVTALSVVENTKYVIDHSGGNQSTTQIQRDIDFAGLDSLDTFELVNLSAAPVRLTTVGTENYGIVGLPNSSSSTFFLDPYSSYNGYKGGTTIILEKIYDANASSGIINESLSNVGYDITPNKFFTELIPVGGSQETIDFKYFPVGSTTFLTVLGEDQIEYSAENSATSSTMSFFLGSELNTTTPTVTIAADEMYFLHRESNDDVWAIKVAGSSGSSAFNVITGTAEFKGEYIGSAPTISESSTNGIYNIIVPINSTVLWFTFKGNSNDVDSFGNIVFNYDNSANLTERMFSVTPFPLVGGSANKPLNKFGSTS